MKKSLIAISLALAHLAAQAAGTATGLVVTTAVEKPGFAFVTNSVNATGKPACATQNRWAMDLSTNSGKAMYATLIAAKATGSTVYMLGNGSCSIVLDTEDLYYIVVSN